MPAFTASAPGKIILFGEHAVVYGHPAIAVPVTQVRATATVTANIRGTVDVSAQKNGVRPEPHPSTLAPAVTSAGVRSATQDAGLFPRNTIVPLGIEQIPADDMRILAPDVGMDSTLGNLPPGEPIGEAVRGVAAILGMHRFPACTLKVTSTIPVAAGLGSGAAVSVAIIRALAGFLGQPLPDEQVSALAYEVEKIHHGTPSGIDNTVVTYARPVYFVKGQPAETFAIARPFTIVIGDTGISSPTGAVVGDVRAGWQVEPKRYERLFAAAGKIAKIARQSIESGHPERLGPLMDENHEVLQKMGVSSPELDRLVAAAREAGALGAKLSGGGRGGNMIALAAAGRADEIIQALREAGATGAILTKCSAS